MRTEITSKSNAGKARPASGRRVARYLPLALIAATSLTVFATGANKYLTVEHLVASRDQLAAWVGAHRVLAVCVYMAIYALSTALSIPGGLLFTVAGGFLFGGAAGGLAAVVAATFGATVLFAAARSSFGEILRARAGPFLCRLSQGFDRDAVSYMLFLRLVPAFPFWLVNLAPALLGVRLKTFVWTTFVGILPGTFAYAFAGAGLDSVANAQKQAYLDCLASGEKACRMHLYLHQLVTKELIFAFAALGVVALLPVLLRRLRRPRPS